MTESKDLLMLELADTELDAVGGGFFHIDVGNTLVQTNTGVQVGLALGSVTQLMNQQNFGVI
jgi:hypothetical protein